MQFHRSRLIDHVHLRVRDLDASKRFYRAVLTALGNVVAVRIEAVYHGPADATAESIVITPKRT